MSAPPHPPRPRIPKYLRNSTQGYPLEDSTARNCGFRRCPKQAIPTRGMEPGNFIRATLRNEFRTRRIRFDLSEFQTLIPVSGLIQVSNSLTALGKKVSYSISFNGLADSQSQSTMAAELPLNSVAAGVLERTGIPCLPDAAADQDGFRFLRTKRADWTITKIEFLR
jgi:hypothetical protein